jgi:hypothetical protein
MPETCKWCDFTFEGVFDLLEHMANSHQEAALKTWGLPPAARGQCEGCKAWFLLTPDGMIGPHTTLSHIGKFGVPDCEGSGKPPYSEEVTEEEMKYLYRSLGIESEHSSPAPPTAIFRDPEEG